MAVKCGNRMAHGADRVMHETVADVRACYAESARIDQELREQEAQQKAEQEAERRNERWFEDRGEPEDQRERELQMMEDEQRMAFNALAKLAGDDEPQVTHASDNQVEYIMDLLKRRVWPHSHTEQDLRAMERRQASKLIDALKQAPLKQAPLTPGTAKDSLERYKDVPAGRYAVLKTHPMVDGRDDDDWTFVQVDKPKDGRWVGYIFVKLLYGAPGDFQKVRASKSQAADLLAKIAKDPAKASADFGKHVGQCGVCRSPLTNEESRAYGIGPICRGKMGW